MTSSEVQNFKRELKSLLEDSKEVADQLDQFLNPQIYTWVKLMSILESYSLGRKELQGGVP
jgi:hypothetical protein